MKKKICVVGTGQWGMNHVETLHKMGCLRAVVDKNINILKKIKTKYSYISCFKNLDTALKKKYDGYIVATPAETHFEIAKKIIENKNHILIEKPITLNSLDAIKLNKLAKDNNVNLMVGHVLLFHPAFQTIKKMIDDNILGEIQYLYSNRLNLGKIRTEENVFWSFAPHDISLFQYFCSDFPCEIQSVGQSFIQPNIHDTTITTLKYKNNIMGHIFVNWLHHFKEHRFVIIGSKGMISFEDSSIDKPLVYYTKEFKYEGNLPVITGSEKNKIEYEMSMPLTNELKYFMNHLDGEKIEIANGESAIEVIKILELATKSLMDKKI